MIFYRYLFYGLVATALLQSIFYYPQMPAVVASHFDGAGAANGWSSRSVFFAIYLAMIAMTVGIFAWLPRWSGARGRTRMNVPNRDYWLAPQRREQTMEFFCRQMMLLGIVHLLLAVFTLQLAILANLQQEPRLHGSMPWALGCYFLLVSLWVIHLVLHFCRPRDRTG
jgi:uncharacterized membrane protein